MMKRESVKRCGLRQEIGPVCMAIVALAVAAGCGAGRLPVECRAGAGKLPAPYPVLLVPGIGFDAEFWKECGIARGLKRIGWKYGGEISIGYSGSPPSLQVSEIKGADFYALSFSYSQAGITKLGRELGSAVRAARRATGADKVILIGHSMGGIACREYLAGADYDGDVAMLIMIGSPNLGSDFTLRKWIVRHAPAVLRKMAWDADPQSDAVRDLRPSSVYLEGGREQSVPDAFRSKDVNGDGDNTDLITGLNHKPLPIEVRYASLIGYGCPFFSTTEQCRLSDGIVTERSQNLNEVPGINVRAKVVRTVKDHFGEADDIKDVCELLVEMMGHH